MISKVARPILRSIRVNTGSVRCKGAGHDLIPKDKALMDLLPVPQGPWEDLYRANNAKYNRHLVGGIAFFIAAVSVAYSQGFLFMNAVPPPLPKKN